MRTRSSYFSVFQFRVYRTDLFRICRVFFYFQKIDRRSKPTGVRISVQSNGVMIRSTGWNLPFEKLALKYTTTAITVMISVWSSNEVVPASGRRTYHRDGWGTNITKHIKPVEYVSTVISGTFRETIRSQRRHSRWPGRGSISVIIYFVQKYAYRIPIYVYIAI